VLHAPGDGAGSSAVTNRNIRQTREFEQALSEDLGALLTRVTNGTPASVVVRATMNFDEQETQTETFDPETQVTLRESTNEEVYAGTGAIPGGVVGVDGGPLVAGEAGESTYDRNEVLREYGVDKVVGRTVAAPGRIERLSVAVVMDDGTETGLVMPGMGEIEALATAALGLDAERGDSIAVTMLPLPAPVDAVVPDEAEPTIADRLPEGVAALVLLIVAIALFLMARRRKATAVAIDVTPHPLPQSPAQLIEAPVQAPQEPDTTLQREVAELVERQPEEIATLLRGWLADRRSA
jgi:flagellar M-ring protein FliF